MNPRKYAENNKPDINISTQLNNNFPLITVEQQRALQERRLKLLRVDLDYSRAHFFLHLNGARTFVADTFQQRHRAAVVAASILRVSSR